MKTRKIILNIQKLNTDKKILEKMLMELYISLECSENKPRNAPILSLGHYWLVKKHKDPPLY